MIALLFAQADAVHLSITVIISIAAGIVSALCAVVVYQDRRIIALAAAKDRAEEGRLADLRASGAETRAVLERVVPVLERVAIEMRMRSERAARRRGEDDSEPPRSSGSELEDTAIRLARHERDAELERRRLNALTSGTGAT